ncbi:malonate decarboxylase holo-ACP synthase [Mesobacillus boroniphilus]|uniref:Malonate decarboxylase holo-ACP synthase n=1 Tax=Mesobacillus boroniphilus TaxID=308892 RepID=A0A944GVT2_9BACI|nr:malonate decarboxylase holo-ACP synthase [Mesobacillus boroniphilus]MBS8263874.1 malonate decarboxylase holo-ACP synthase [Mesobacillus boroniphilus]
MELETHDLLEIDKKDLISHTEIPEWAVHSLENTPFVVVRRVHAPEGQVAVGIRGRNRNQRFGAFLEERKVIRQIKPEQLTSKKMWEDKQADVFSALDMAASIFRNYEISWGPGGSVGFELASGVVTVTSESDLDLIIRAHQPLPIADAVAMVERLERSNVRIDVQVETPAGGFSLKEYTRDSGSFLLKTKIGPKLTRNPWNEEVKKF